MGSITCVTARQPGWTPPVHQHTGSNWASFLIRLKGQSGIWCNYPKETGRILDSRGHTSSWGVQGIPHLNTRTPTQHRQTHNIIQSVPSFHFVPFIFVHCIIPDSGHQAPESDRWRCEFTFIIGIGSDELRTWLVVCGFWRLRKLREWHWLCARRWVNKIPYSKGLTLWFGLIEPSGIVGIVNEHYCGVS